MEKHTLSAPRLRRGRNWAHLLVITVIDTLAWLVITAALAAMIGNSTPLQIADALVFTALWFAAVRIWSPRP